MFLLILLHELLTTLNSLIDNCYIFIFDTLPFINKEWFSSNSRYTITI